MNKDYQTEVITNDMMEAEKVIIILQRIFNFMLWDTEMSDEDREKVVGDDPYTLLTLDSVGKSLNGADSKEVTAFIRKELKERNFELANIAIKEEV